MLYTDGTLFSWLLSRSFLLFRFSILPPPPISTFCLIFQFYISFFRVTPFLLLSLIPRLFSNFSHYISPCSLSATWTIHQQFLGGTNVKWNYIWVTRTPDGNRRSRGPMLQATTVSRTGHVLQGYIFYRCIIVIPTDSFQHGFSTWLSKWCYPSNRPWSAAGSWDVQPARFCYTLDHRWRRGRYPKSPGPIWLPGIFLAFIPLRGSSDARDILRRKASGLAKIPMTLQGIEHATFRPVA